MWLEYGVIAPVLAGLVLAGAIAAARALAKAVDNVTEIPRINRDLKRLERRIRRLERRVGIASDEMDS